MNKQATKMTNALNSICVNSEEKNVKSAMEAVSFTPYTKILFSYIIFFNDMILQKCVSNEFGSNDSLDSMEKAKSGTLSTPSSIDDSIQPVESPDEDPWAIVDLVDNSEKWEGIRQLFDSFILIHSYHKMCSFALFLCRHEYES